MKSTALNQSGLEVKDKIESERTIKIAPFNRNIRKTSPHKHNNYFEIIYLASGSGYHFIDLQKFKVAPPVIYLVRKEQVHYWELTKKPEGFVIIIRKSFMEKTLDNQLKSLLAKISRQNSLSVRNHSTIHKLFELLAGESKTESVHSFHTIEGLLKALISKVLEVSKPAVNKMEVKSGLYQSFVNILGSESPVKIKVAHYATILNTSPQNLNAACRKAVNQSATEVLGEFILNEAKRLLLYTDKTISQIAYDLDFSDPSHFVKYFKKGTSQTPQHYRTHS